MNYSAAPVINLLSERKISFDRRLRAAQKVKLWAGVVLVVYVIALVLVLGVSQIVSAKVNRVEKALGVAKLELTAQLVKIEQYEAVVNRAKVIKKLLNERRGSIALWNAVKNMMPEAVELTLFTLDGSNLRLGFSAPNVVIANQVVDIVQDGLGEIKPKSMNVDVNRDKSARYVVSVEATLSE